MGSAILEVKGVSLHPFEGDADNGGGDGSEGGQDYGGEGDCGVVDEDGDVPPGALPMIVVFPGDSLLNFNFAFGGRRCPSSVILE